MFINDSQEEFIFMNDSEISAYFPEEYRGNLTATVRATDLFEALDETEFLIFVLNNAPTFNFIEE